MTHIKDAGRGYTLLLVVGPAHAVLAFSPAAEVPTWREAYPARAAGRRQPPVVDDVPPEGWPQDTGPGPSTPIPADSG